MAPPRVENKKLSKERSKQKAAKKDSKSSLPTTAVAVAVTALIAVCVAVYYKNGYKIEKELDKATTGNPQESTGSAGDKRNDINTDFKILPRLNGVKVSELKWRVIKHWLSTAPNDVSSILYLILC